MVRVILCLGLLIMKNSIFLTLTLTWKWGGQQGKDTVVKEEPVNLRVKQHLRKLDKAELEMEEMV